MSSALSSNNILCVDRGKTYFSGNQMTAIGQVLFGPDARYRRCASI
jgi:hypothetical protein